MMCYQVDECSMRRFYVDFSFSSPSVCPQNNWDRSLAPQVESFRSPVTLEYMPFAAGNDPFGVTAGSCA